MSEGFKEVKIDVGLTEEWTYVNLYQNWYAQKLHTDFIQSKEDKKHNMNSHSNWFNKKIKINHEEEQLEIINKWKLCMVDFGMNIWTEINGVRPSIIYKSSSSKYGEDIIVLPITSYKDWEEWDSKSVDEFDIAILPDSSNNLTNRSLIKIRQMRCVSKKRVRPKKWSKNLNIFWDIEDKTLREQINTNVRQMLWI